MLDADGYPDEKSLKHIEKFDFDQPTIDGVTPMDVYLNLIEDNWWAADWGFRIIKIRGRRFLELSCGGWSGNEEIIESMKKNIFWYRLKVKRIGGHYLFEIDSPKLDEKNYINPKDLTELCEHCNGWGIV